MRVIVDRDRCQGHNRCYAEAPKLFDLDDELKSVVLVDIVPADQQDAARAAERNCPERAITLVDGDG
jgi:ferredoxin